jgi:hypothetical protein
LGGFGLIVQPAVTFNVFNAGRSHIGIDVRIEYGQWFASDTTADATRVFLSAAAGVSYSFH